MKTLFASLLTMLILVSCSTTEHSGFTIAGQVENGDTVEIRLDAREQGEWITLDTAVIENGSFTLSGAVEHPEMVYLKFIKGDEINYTTVFLENSAITIQGDADDVDALAINGSSVHDEYAVFAGGMDQVTEPYDTLYELHSLAGSDQIKDSLEQLIKEVEEAEEQYVLDYISSNATSPVAPYAAIRSLAYYMEYDQLKPVVDQIIEGGTETKYLTSLNEMLVKLKQLAIGAKAPDFTEVLVDGSDFSMSSLAGKYVLLDFWASWCGPCRRENPNVVAMYEELGGEDFEIVGISLDKHRDKWLQAIDDDKLTWVHVSDLKGWKCAVADIYNVKAIPKTYLLDRDGNIVAKNLRGNELKDKIRELLAAES
ncbi:MAG: AhpC/TSA family protein [Bacteroidetes bacterium]|nr:AhpC/TSA family protein [Bacteroidota bacterium]